MTAIAACLALAGPAQAAPQPKPVVSQVYGGGGNVGAQLRNDFIEIFNREGAPLDLTGYSVQYGPATSGIWQVTPLSGTLDIGEYLLISEAAGLGGQGEPLPPADAIGNIEMSSSAGKVALVSSFTPLTGPCPTGPEVLDLVGYGASANCFEGAGPTANSSNTTAQLRQLAGCTDTQSSVDDFSAGAPSPRNRSSALNLCFPVPAAPVLTATNPSSPSGSKSPSVIGSAPAGTTVEIYTNASCSGAPVATGTAAQLASPGITVPAAADVTTTFYALAFNANNTSRCSTTSVAYTAVAPVSLNGLRLTPSRFAIKMKATRATTSAGGRAKRGTIVRFSLSARARVRFTVLRHPPVTQPPAPTAGQIKAFGRVLEAGEQAVPFTGRLGKRLFRPGKYRMVVTAQAPSGGPTSSASAPFTILQP